VERSPLTMGIVMLTALPLVRPRTREHPSDYCVCHVIETDHDGSLVVAIVPVKPRTPTSNSSLSFAS